MSKKLVHPIVHHAHHVAAIFLLIFGAILLPMAGVEVGESDGPKTALGFLDCNQLKDDMFDELWNLNYCVTAKDCIVNEELGCPFGCYTLLNIKADMTKAYDYDEIYKKECPPCIHECTMPPEPGEIGCYKGRCVIIDYGDDSIN